MKAFICDRCKKVISNNSKNNWYIDVFKLDICEDCKTEMNKIKNKYDKEMENLNLKEKEIFNKMIKNIEEETGINLKKGIY